MNSSIPAFTTASLNVRGFHNYGRGHSLSMRDKRANANALILKHNLTYFQETNFNFRENNFFRTFLPPKYFAYYSNFSKNTAGVATVISSTICALYHHREIILPDSLRGYALCIAFEAKDGTHSFTSLNVYLSSDGFAARTKQVRTLYGTVPVTPHLFMGGDFNFVEDKYRDTSTHTTHYDSTGSFTSCWASFKDRFNLKEVIQNTHTLIAGSANPETATTSRLDRHYISHCEADWATVRPFAYIPTIPHTILHSQPKGKDGSKPKRAPACSDHLPVSLGFRLDNNEEGTVTEPRIPLWITKDPLFLSFLSSGGMT
jgi:endonuclease/exonuclease/phosphatase family metal-dependent hydrolase